MIQKSNDNNNNNNNCINNKPVLLGSEAEGQMWGQRAKYTKIPIRLQSSFTLKHFFVNKFIINSY